MTIADDVSYAELNADLDEYGQAQVKKGIKIAKALGFVPRMNTNKKEFEELFTRWGIYTYTKLLSEQIFEPLAVCDNKAIVYAPFQTMAQYYISLGYSRKRLKHEKGCGYIPLLVKIAKTFSLSYRAILRSCVCFLLKKVIQYDPLWRICTRKGRSPL